MKYKCFKEGFSPREFKKMEMRDLLEIFEIDNALESKKIRQDNMDQAMANMKW